MALTWDPTHYLTYADERGRPFVELVARIGAEAPRTVVDLGCGPGNLTRLLVDRWPGARVHGLDSSPEMIERARADAGGATYDVADLRSWRPEQPVDVLVSNATLQWVPEHLDLLPGLLDQVADGGWLALQVPGNFDEPSHVLRRDLAERAPYAEHVRGVAHPASHDPVTYHDVLAAAGRERGVEVDVWETTYLHVLRGPDPVFAWVSGTGARPTLQALPDDLRVDFEREFTTLLSQAYPTRDDGTVLLPFRRVFAVAHLGDGS